jgi:hypothetical protein
MNHKTTAFSLQRQQVTTKMSVVFEEGYSGFRLKTIFSKIKHIL